MTPLQRRTASTTAIVLLAASLHAQSTRLETSDVYRRVSKQVVEVDVDETVSGAQSQLGSGFFVSSDGEIITNYHVIEPIINKPKEYRAEWVEASGTKHPLRLLAVDVVHDLAILASDQPAAGYFKLVTVPLAQGTRLYALGHPRGLALSIVEGTYNGLVQYTFYPRIHFTGAINHGMSGGPAITVDGSVVGVNVATAGNSVGFLVPVDFAISLLARASAPGFAAPKEFIADIGAQLSAYQAQYFPPFLADTTHVVTLGAFSVPTLPVSFFKCWGDVTAGEDQRRYDYTEHLCSSDDDIYLADDQATGYAVLKYKLYSSTQLAPLQFYALLEARFGSTDSAMYGAESFVTNFKCRTRNVRRATAEPSDVAVRAATCVRRYKKMPGLYDMVTHVAVFGKKQSGLLATLTLAGVSYENGERIIGRLLERIQ